MDHQGTVIVLDRPRSRGEHSGEAVGSVDRTTPCAPEASGSGTPARVPVAPPVGFGSLLRAPGLALLAAVSLVEGYRWLGVFHTAATGGGSLVFGTAGVGLVALLTPVVAALLIAHRAPGPTVRLGGIVVAVALAVTLTTGSALVIGGHVWPQAAGATDIVLAAVAFAAIALGEYARNRSTRAVEDGWTHGGQAVHGAP